MANFKRKYPLARLRRLRSTKSIRDLVAENKLSTDDLIQPIFVKESLKEMEEIIIKLHYLLDLVTVI